MIAVFSFPLAFWALAAVPALVGIYLLQNRFRRHTISSLIFWIDHKQTREGGVQLEKISTPLLFVLELLSILLLIFAAAGPLIRSKTDRSNFIVVLDDSYSMLCDTKPSPRDKAIEDIEAVFKDAAKFKASFILASRKPAVLASDVTSCVKVREVVSGWKCKSEFADLSGALSLAKELSGNKSRLLVITDRKPDNEILDNSIQWRAYGRSVGNVAFVNASLSKTNDKYRCLLSVANLSDSATQAKIQVAAKNSGSAIVSKTANIEAGAVHRFIFEPLGASLPLVASVGDDLLEIDNHVELLPMYEKNVRVQLDISNQFLHDSIEKALLGNQNVSLSDVSPHLIITDSTVRQDVESSCWVLRIVASEECKAYLGPFVVDQSHPLTDGLCLDGLIWAADDVQLAMQPIVTAGNVPLLLVNTNSAGSKEVFLNLNAELSTVTRSPSWPILFFNLIDWRVSQMPGLEKSNYVSGLTVRYAAESDAESVDFEFPDGQVREIPLLNGQLEIVPEDAGAYKIIEQQVEHSFVVNVVSQAESDLSDSVSGRWGKWNEAADYWWEYRPLDWLLFVIVLALLTLHRYITSKQLEGVRI